MRTSRAILSMLSDEPPKEFRMFVAGWNSTKKGKFLFDDEAAKSVMDQYKAHGVDRPIDLEHMSIDSAAKNYDPDARGWFNMELRDGELWATNVRWTPDGAERLKSGKQRYISPCFAFDKETKRVSEVINAAICAIPATLDAPALVAASLLFGKTFGTLSVEVKKMDIKKILSALGLGDDATEEQALASIKALQDDAGGDGEGEGDEVLKALRAKFKLADDASKEECMKALAGDDKDPPKKDDDKKDEKLTALSLAVVTLSKKIETLTQTSDAEKIQALIEKNTDKIPLGAEEAFSKLSLAQLTSIVKSMPSTPRAATPPKQGGTEIVALSADELKACADSGVDPKMVLKHKQDKAAAKALAVS
jgi:phage I-like protein